MSYALSNEVVKEILAHGQLYEVGGAVRDRLLNVEPNQIKDKDYLVTRISYDHLTGILKKHGRVDLVGKSFGVIKFTQFHEDESVTFDVTLPRTEHSTGVGHKDFSVCFDPNLAVEQDLIRRDFTINAMALEIDSNRLIDPLDGEKDLANKLLRMTSERSFEEDPLRMLRAIQFAARFNLEIEPNTFASMKKHAALIESITPERVSEELNKLLLGAKEPSIGFRLMHQSGLLARILPELETCVGVDQPGPYHKWDVFEHTLHCIDAAPQNLMIRLAALFHDITKPQHKRVNDGRASFYGHETSGARTAQTVLTRLRYPKDLIKNVVTLAERHMFTTDVTDKGLRRLIRRVGVDLIFDLLELRRADTIAQGMGQTTEDVDRFEQLVRAELAKKPPFGLSDLAVNGNELMTAFKLSPGPKVGIVLDQLLEHVLDTPGDNTRERLMDLAKSMLAHGVPKVKKDKNEE